MSNIAILPLWIWISNPTGYMIFYNPNTIERFTLFTGTFAQYLDCAAILTDLEKSNVRTLCLSDALKITAYLKGQG